MTETPRPRTALAPRPMLGREEAAVLHDELNAGDQPAPNPADKPAPETTWDHPGATGGAPANPNEPVPNEHEPEPPLDAADRARKKLDAKPTPRDKLRRVSLNIPPEAYDALFERSHRNRTTITFEIFKALRGNGIPIRDADMIQDGRRNRGAKKK